MAIGNKLTGKGFIHKVYDQSGNYLTTWNPEKENMNIPSFQWSINSGLGNMTVELARSITDFGEGSDVKLGNRIMTYILDDDHHLGTKIYDGKIMNYEVIVNDNGENYIRIEVYSQSTTLQDRMLKAGNNTTITYSTTSVSEIVKDILNKYNEIIQYTTDSINLDTDSITYVFKYITYLEALKKCLEMCPAYWYWYIDPDNIFWLQPADWDKTDHTLFLGKQISSISASNSMENLYNSVYFLGGIPSGLTTNLYKKYDNSSSQSEWGIRDYQMRDTRVTTAATTQKMADKFLNEHASPETVIRIKVLDNSIDLNKGYDIESFKPGQIIWIKDPKTSIDESLWDEADFDEDYWDFASDNILGQPVQIKSITYNFFDCELELSSKPQEIDERINNIDKSLEVLESENIPNNPT